MRAANRSRMSMVSFASSADAVVPGWLIQRPVAHRGLHRLPNAPENSFAAFLAAADAGYPAEMDVYLLADGEIAVFHDDTLARLTGAEGRIADQTAATLRGATLRLAGTEEPIPLLSDLLEKVAGRTPLLIEVKSKATDPVGPLEDALTALLRGYSGPFALQAFRVETVEYLKRNNPDWCVGQLASDDAWAEKRVPDPNFRPDPDFLAYRLSAPPTPLTTVFRETGRPLLVWTVAKDEEIKQAQSVADNFIFDHVRPILKER